MLSKKFFVGIFINNPLYFKTSKDGIDYVFFDKKLKMYKPQEAKFLTSINYDFIDGAKATLRRVAFTGVTVYHGANFQVVYVNSKNLESTAYLYIDSENEEIYKRFTKTPWWKRDYPKGILGDAIKHTFHSTITLIFTVLGALSGGIVGYMIGKAEINSNATRTIEEIHAPTQKIDSIPTKDTTKK